MLGKIKKVAFEYYYALITISLGVPVIVILMLMLLSRYALITLGLTIALLTAGVNLKDKNIKRQLASGCLKCIVAFHGESLVWVSWFGVSRLEEKLIKKES